MSIAKKRNFIIVSLFLLAALLLGIGFSELKTTFASAPLPWGEDVICYVGDSFDIPSDIKVDGEDFGATDCIVYYPSGKAQKVSRLTLDEAGKYTVEYRKTVDGKLVVVEKNFIANRTLYSFSGNKSTADFGLDDSQYNTKKTALNVNLKSGETFYFNKVFNVNELDGAFINLYATPERKGVRDVQGFWVYLTDVYDANNYIGVQFKSVTYNGQSYVYLCSYVMAKHGKETPVAWDAKEKRVRINDQFGAGAYMSLYGNAEEYGERPVKDNYCKFIYNAEEKAVYVDTYKSTLLICDFDNPTFFSNLWEGFETGEVKLSIEGYGYTGQNFYFSIEEVAGMTTADLAAELGFHYDENNKPTDALANVTYKGIIVDNVAPAINVESNGYDLSNLPDGFAGKYYPVFPATAFDIYDGEVDVQVHAYYGSESDGEVEIDVQNGKILTYRAGKYAVVYSATDRSGNTAQYPIHFYVRPTVDQIVVTLEETSANCTIGDLLTLPAYEVEGGAGAYQVTIQADKKCTLDEKTGTIRPLEVGTMAVKYLVEDMTGNAAQAVYTITVAMSDVPVVIDTVVLPKYLLGGKAYQFPTVVAHDFKAGADKTADLYVNGEKVANGKYQPVEKAGEEEGQSYSVTAEYRVGNHVVVPATEITVLDVTVKKPDGPGKNILLQNYWISEGFDVSINSESLVFLSESGVSHAETEYAKQVLYNSFGISMKIRDGEKVGSFYVLLEDAANPANVLKIGFANDTVGYSTVLTLNDEPTMFKLSSGGYYAEEYFNVYVEDGYLKDGGSINQKISHLFSADKVNVRVVFDGIESGAQIQVAINNLCGVALNSTVTADRIAPVTNDIVSEYPAFTELGSTITILPIIAEDFMDTYVEATVTVTLKRYDGKKIDLLTNADATVAHVVKLDEYGDCTIQYSVKDTAGTPRSPKATVRVVNLVEPTITVDGSFLEGVKLGSTITFPNATAVDDVDGALEVNYFVVMPSGTIKMLTGREYTPTVAGRYKIRIYAMDGSGNIAMVEKEFTVVK